MPPRQAHSIRIRNARQNNLKGFDLALPIGKLTVVTGLSGAGKSSLVFQTLHAEGQRRYVETFSPYTRQFMELLDRPKVDAIENVRPSIAIQQSNTVKTSRSTVGTITELCDYFKVWFANFATLYDPATGKPIVDDNPQSVWRDLLRTHPGATVLVAFAVTRPEPLDWTGILRTLSGQGFARVVHEGRVERVDDLLDRAADLPGSILVVQDRIRVESGQRSRALEALQHAFGFGNGRIQVIDTKTGSAVEFTHGLNSPETGVTFRRASPALFSFNSPIGACATCRGFGRVIEIDKRLVVPDRSVSIDDGAIRAFQGEVYSESLRDLQAAARKHKVRTHIPWSRLNKRELKFVWEGDPGYKEGYGQWYGIDRFFGWLEKNLYKMHVRVFLSKFRSYTPCPDCGGARLQPESLNWKWRGYTLPDLYRLHVGALRELIGSGNGSQANGGSPSEGDLAYAGICSRLEFLEQVGLGYLTLDRTSRTLSGGETMRVNLTTCLGASLVDTLFVLDEPSVGLHARDMDRLIAILRRLTGLGNTVVVVEHDEAVMRAADHLVEIGPRPGSGGGQLSFSGSYKRILKSNTHTGRFLSGRETIDTPRARRDTETAHTLSLYGISKHNLNELDVHIPLQRFVCLSGVSGSGKSTLLNNAIYQNLLASKGLVAEEPAALRDLNATCAVSEVVLVDQSPLSKTPRSNPASYSKAWDEIRTCFARLDAAQSAGMGPGHFSFNSGDGRCPTCSGLGFERIEMQFVSDLFVPCETCEGKRFKPEVLEIEYNGLSIADILELDIGEAVVFFADKPKVAACLQPMVDVGLGYLRLGQPLNTLSGGESQRLKLVRYLGKVASRSGHALILIDEPTTGLHRADVKRLLAVLQSLVEAGHSLVVIEHNLDVLKTADWIIEMGPEAGARGGRIIAEGRPEAIVSADCETAAYMAAALTGSDASTTARFDADRSVAETPARYEGHRRTGKVLRVSGAREHNLKGVDCEIQHNRMTVITGVSGSGKSSLAFDIIFAEGQRRYMESMSAYARQFVEQMPRADVDDLQGIAPTVAIEQRVTKGTRKSTVATITEVAQYLRLLFARVGVQHSPVTGEAVVSQSEHALLKRLKQTVKQAGKQTPHLCAPLIRGRKGHHEPIANWARDHGYTKLRIDGTLTEIANFRKLDRYREHDIDLVIAELNQATALKPALADALRLGKGSAFLMNHQGTLLSWLSTKRTDPTTGEAFPELDPKHFSWNSPRGWCPTCRGYGQLFAWMGNEEESRVDHIDDFEDGEICPECAGTRLNALSRSVRLPLSRGDSVSLPELLTLTPGRLLETLSGVQSSHRNEAVLGELLPEIGERMRFMDRVGLDYLQLDRATATLSGGEAQRIRLAAQLGSNLSGVLYVLDEPSIGLHARDNEKLIESLEHLRNRGNTLVVVEHDETTMRHADQIIDLGPAAGIHGGEIVASGTLAQLKRCKRSLTGQYLRKPLTHPLRGERRPLPRAWAPRRSKTNDQWICLQGAALRNLKGFDVQFPKRRLSAICGVSGAGKSTLVRDLLRPLVEDAVRARKSRYSRSGDHRFKALHHAEDIRKVIEVDQSPIGKTPRSTPATYIGAFDLIREIYASLPEARLRGYTAGTFSFNTKGGRCETCKGAGRVKLEMNFMPDTHVTCEDCNGRRYGAELDELRWNGKSIADALALSFEEAAGFFSFHTRLSGLMQLMVETGLGYITLGQYSPTLSGGEAQRMKLVSELAKGQPSYKERLYNRGQGNLYILEEPTIGLHLSDVERLIELLHRLVDHGHTVLVIEHHLNLIADADYVVEIGPDGGEGGGQLLYQGDVDGLRQSADSITAAFL